MFYTFNRPKPMLPKLTEWSIFQTSLFSALSEMKLGCKFLGENDFGLQSVGPNWSGVLFYARPDFNMM